jgi:hypothetical protein
MSSGGNIGGGFKFSGCNRILWLHLITWRLGSTPSRSPKHWQGLPRSFRWPRTASIIQLVTRSVWKPILVRRVNSVASAYLTIHTRLAHCRIRRYNSRKSLVSHDGCESVSHGKSHERESLGQQEPLQQPQFITITPIVDSTVTRHSIRSISKSQLFSRATVCQ